MKPELAFQERSEHFKSLSGGQTKVCLVKALVENVDFLIHRADHETMTNLTIRREPKGTLAEADPLIRGHVKRNPTKGTHQSMSKNLSWT